MADKLTNLDTGTGGFKIPTADSDGTAQVYKSIPKGEVDNTDPILWDSGNIHVDLEQKDLSRKIKETLADYLGKLTKGKSTVIAERGKNYYSLDSEVVNEIKIDDGITSNSNSESFRDVGDSISSSVQEIRGWTYGSRKLVEPTNIDKRRQANPYDPTNSPNYKLKFESPKFTPGLKDKRDDEINGHTLLSKIEDNNSPVIKYSSALLTNRFSADNQFPQNNDSIDNVRFVNTQYEMGTSAGQGSQVSYGQMKQVGSIMMARSSYEIGSLESDSLSSRQFKALLPSAAQLGLRRIPQSELEARSVLEQIANSNEEDIKKDTKIIEITKNSWGSMFTNFESFSGIDSISTAILSAILVVATSILLESFAFVIGLILKPIGYKIPADGDQKMVMGHSYVTEPGWINEVSHAFLNDYLVLDPIFSQQSLITCSTEGLKYLFLPSGASSLIPFFGGGQAGYHVTICRTMLRSFAALGEMLESPPKGNLFISAIQIIEMITGIANSKFMRMLNMIVQIGDRSLCGAKYKELYSDVKSGIDGDNAHNKIRLDSNFKGSKQLAYSLTRSADKFITNANFEEIRIRNIIDQSSAGAPKGIEYTSTYKMKNVVNVELSNRISDDLRELYESHLDAEYVPFYLHDLRTNEFLSFHAFLTSLEDGYTANYDTTDGIGRIEPIKIYKNTSRKMGFSFILAATSAEDFQYMWHKINKLTTMVYPQYSEGKEVNDFEGQKYKIYAPFSQMMQAAPMVRLRIGDLIKSNYSKFDLARLFGLGAPGTQFNNKPIPTVGIDDPDAREKVEDELYLDNTLGLTFYFRENKTEVNGQLWPNAPLAAANGHVISLSQNYKINKSVVFTYSNLYNAGQPNAYMTFIGERIAVSDNGSSDADVTALNEPPKAAEQLATGTSVKGKAKAAKAAEVPKQLTQEEKELQGYWGDKGALLISIPLNGLSVVGALRRTFELTTDGLSKFTTALSAKSDRYKVATEGDAGKQQFQNYYDEAMNAVSLNEKGSAIAKSFRSTGGKGLAGFIENLSFSWLDQTTWEGVGQQNGNIAPKMCKITISFAPIHDISPGLDYAGINRAPLYRVGPYNVKDQGY